MSSWWRGERRGGFVERLGRGKKVRKRKFGDFLLLLLRSLSLSALLSFPLYSPPKPKPKKKTQR
jgi:hypothetical protein